MKVKGREKANWNIDNELSTKSWCKMVDWTKTIPFINFTSMYPKGTPTTSKSIIYHQSLNNIAERIQVNNKIRFRTMSEIFRVALHIGMQVLYHVFCVEPNLETNSRGYFFFKELEQAQRLFERAQMIARLDDVIKNLQECIKHETVTEKDAYTQFVRLLDAMPEVDRAYAKEVFAMKEENAGKILQFKRQNRNIFMDAVNPT